MSTSIKLLRHQGAMLNTIANILLSSVKPKKGEIKETTLETNILGKTPNTKIVTEYHKWLGAEKRYNNTIAPHLFPLWSYPELFKLGQSLNLPLHKVLNQGCKMIINNQLPQSEALNTNIEIFKVQNLEQKYRINQRIITGNQEHPEALVAEIYAVILKDSKNFLKKTKASKEFDTSKFKLIKSQFISKKDAQSYAYLSGDVNPIHLSKHIAKLIGLKHSIMHGFGLFAIIFENLQNAGYKIREIDIRFLSPVFLESNIQIYVNQINDEKCSIRVLSEDKMKVHLSGEFKLETLKL